jgi:hypothetical protein
VFTPDVEYNVRHSVLARALSGVARSRAAVVIGNMPVVEFDGDRATGMQHFIFVDQQKHAMRLGWYNDEYVRTEAGWRIRRRATTFMRKHGGFDTGRQHDPLADTH